MSIAVLQEAERQAHWFIVHLPGALVTKFGIISVIVTPNN
jgi:hypothetical protein